MKWGALWLALAMAMRIAPALGLLIAEWLGYRFGYAVYYWCEWMQWWVLPLGIGAILITSAFAPDQGRHRWAVPFRLVARWIVLLWAFQEIAMPLLYFALTHNGVKGAQGQLLLTPGWRRIFATSEWMYWPVWMVGLLGLLSHVFIIAARLRGRQLFLQLRTLTVILAVWSLVFYNLDAIGDWVDHWGTPSLASFYVLLDFCLHNASGWTELLLEAWAAALMLWLAGKYSTPLPEQALSSP